MINYETRNKIINHFLEQNIELLHEISSFDGARLCGRYVIDIINRPDLLAHFTS